MKNFKLKIVSLILVFSFIFTSTVNIFANYHFDLNNSSNLNIIESGLFLNDKFYSIDEFEHLLENSDFELNENINNSNRSLALVAGTWYIPGVGQVVITITGAVIVAGATVTVGSWVYDKVVEWFEIRAFNQSAEDALDKVDSNKIHHIMQTKHNWDKIKNNPNWNKIKPILLMVLKDGDETW